MKFFLDTTNPTLVAKEQVPFALVAEICRLVPGHVSLETNGATAEAIVGEGQPTPSGPKSSLPALIYQLPRCLSEWWKHCSDIL